MTATDRLNELRNMAAATLCTTAEDALIALVEIMNRETVLLRAGDYKNAADLSAPKAQLAQDYVGLARAVQHEAKRLKTEAPAQLQQLQDGHEKLTTQMAENLRVLATAKTVTQTLLSDVAQSVGGQTQTSTYGASGKMTPQSATGGAKGIAINRAM